VLFGIDEMAVVERFIDNVVRCYRNLTILVGFH